MSKNKTGKFAKTAERKPQATSPQNGGRFCRCGVPLVPYKRVPGWKTIWRCSVSHDLPEECKRKPEPMKQKTEPEGEAIATVAPKTSSEVTQEVPTLEATP